jgi:hypothetical protein
MASVMKSDRQAIDQNLPSLSRRSRMLRAIGHNLADT